MANETLEVCEIFSSIQGESTFSGLPCIFVRLSGCNLRCSYCDSRYAYEEKGRITPVEEILAIIAASPGILVEITGGEPLLQYNVHFLIEKLLAENRTVLLETNGSLNIEAIPVQATVIMDIKCPGSGESSLFPDNIEIIKKRASKRTGATEIKFVLSSLHDYNWAKTKVLQDSLHTFAPILFAPVQDRLPPRALAEMILSDKLPVRLQVQLHTLLWPEVSRGV
jgi:7-carboxy-7-deazaguanine synthase